MVIAKQFLRELEQCEAIAKIEGRIKHKTFWRLTMLSNRRSNQNHSLDKQSI